MTMTVLAASSSSSPPPPTTGKTRTRRRPTNKNNNNNNGRKSSSTTTTTSTITITTGQNDSGPDKAETLSTSPSRLRLGRLGRLLRPRRVVVSFLSVVCCIIIKTTNIIIPFYIIPLSPPMPYNNNNNNNNNTTTTTTKNDNNDDRLVDLNDLEFVHIPKTGGTAIEQMGWEQNQIRWGIRQMMFPRKWLFDGRCPPWHTPPKIYLSSHDRNQDEDEVDKNHNDGERVNVTNTTTTTTQISLDDVRLNHNPYRNKTLFTIVRNPYDRVISEYYFDAQMRKQLSVSETHNPDALNRYISFFIRSMNETMKTNKTTNNNNNSGYDYTTRCYSHGHWIPQHEFVYDDRYLTKEEEEEVYEREGNDDENNETNRGRRDGGRRRHRLVKYVLKYETLQEDLYKLQQHVYIGSPHRNYSSSSSSSSSSQLLSQSNQPNFTLPSTKHHPTTKQMTVQNLTSYTRKLIESYYKYDFELFGYDIWYAGSNHSSSRDQGEEGRRCFSRNSCLGIRRRRRRRHHPPPN